MSNPPSAQTLSYEPKPVLSTGLQSNALGLVATAAMTAAYMGPALSIYGVFDPMTAKVGIHVGFAMFISIAFTLPSAISFGMLAKEVPSAGGLYAWSRMALGESAGTWIGLTTTMYYTICLFFCPIIFGQYFTTAMNQIFDTPPESKYVFAAGFLLMMLLAVFIVYRGIVVSSHLTVTLLVIEIAVIVAMAITAMVYAVRHGGWTVAPLTLGSVKSGSGGWTAAFLALPLALLCMCCDGATPAGEETKNAKWTIPVAVLMTCLIVGAWYIFGFSAFAMAHAVPEIAGDEQRSTLEGMIAFLWGRARILVSITAMTAALGSFIPCAIAASRVIFAMSRDGKLPDCFATLHAKYASPWNAIHLIFGLTLAIALPCALLYGMSNTIDWWSNPVGWCIGIVYLGANLSNIVYYYRYARDRFHPILNLVIPVFAIGVQIFVLYSSIVVAPWQAGWKGQSSQLFIAFIALSTLGYVLFIRKSDSKSQRGFDVVTAEEGA